MNKFVVWFHAFSMCDCDGFGGFADYGHFEFHGREEVNAFLKSIGIEFDFDASSTDCLYLGGSGSAHLYIKNMGIAEQSCYKLNQQTITHAGAVMNKLAEKRVYQVEVIEKQSNSSWGVDVIASSVREARRFGVEVLEFKGLINRRNIKRTGVYETGTTVWGVV